MRRPSVPSVTVPSRGALAFSALAGVFLLLTVIKLGNPVILDTSVPPPATATEVIFEAWPSAWAVPIFVPVIIAGLFAIHTSRLKLRWFVLMPAAWLGWEYIASAWTISPELTTQTLRHFTIAVALFYLAYFGWERECEWPIWTGLGLGICYAMRVAIEQHFGGLAATAKMLYTDPSASGLSPSVLHDPAFQARMAKLRVFGTYVYPNAFAGGLLLLLPPTMAFVWKLTPKVRRQIRVGFVAILGGMGVACLFWSGSRAGWLVALAVGSIALWQSPAPMRWKRGILAAVILIGLAAFAFKNIDYFRQRGKSVGARVEYWKAACRIAARNPIVGTGPGTFSIPFNHIKPSEAESARLTHNDYLEQACDSGIPGFVTYSVAILGGLYILYRYRMSPAADNWLELAAFLGLCGLALHMLVEFHLYIPALAWPMFFLLGGQLGLYVNDNGRQN